MNDVAASPAALQRARISVTTIFVIFGVNVGVWAAHIPLIKTHLGINPGVLGLALLAAAAGTILSQPSIGALISRLGSRRPTAVLAALTMLAPSAGIYAPTLPLLFVACFFFGALMGGLNVAMNTQASEIETLVGRPILSTFHAGASIGMLIGAALAGFAIGQGWTDGGAALAVAAIAIIVAFATMPWLIDLPPQARGPAFILPSRAVFGLGALAFLMFIVEGGLVDWAALFLATDKGLPPAWAATGFGAFTAMMTLLRLLGSQVIERLGRKRTVIVGGALVAAGILVSVLSPWPALSVIGFAIVGIGAANIVPILISTAARTPGMAPSVAIGAVSTMLTCGFLVGPPLIGFVSNATSLSAGVSLLALSGLVVAIAAAFRTWPGPSSQPAS